MDVKLQNKRGYTIHGSFYQQANINTPLPCIVYCHGNGCSRLEAIQYADLVLSNSVLLFTFDFTACGKSGGLYSSVGWHEQEDLQCVLDYLYGTNKVTKICLWGRSMGATTALLYTAKNPKISCLILDSPYANFKKLIKEIAEKQASIPGFLTTGAYNMIRGTILKKAEVDLDELKPIKYVDKIKVPALFGVGKDDNFVPPHHTNDLYLAYLGEKKMEVFEGDHNSGRPIPWMKSVLEFIKKNLLAASKEMNLGPMSNRLNPGIQVPRSEAEPNNSLLHQSGHQPTIKYSHNNLSSLHRNLSTSEARNSIKD